MRDFSHLTNYWKDNTAGHKQASKEEIIYCDGGEAMEGQGNGG